MSSVVWYFSNNKLVISTFLALNFRKFTTKYPVGLFLWFLTQRPNITYESGKKIKFGTETSLKS